MYLSDQQLEFDGEVSDDLDLENDELELPTHTSGSQMMESKELSFREDTINGLALIMA